MIWSSLWRWLRAKPAPARRKPSNARLAVELLEDRLVPSTTGGTDPAYLLWRQQNYSVDLAVSETLTQLDASPPTANANAQSVPANGSFGSLIGMPSAFTNTPYRGTGYSVAVIDTGIDYTHTDLGSGFGPGHRVVAGWDFANNDADPLDDNGHGTHVAGIIGGSSATYSGVAPGVNLIALKVLDASGSGSFGTVEDALQWVVAHQNEYHIVAVNMSLGAGNYTSNPYTFLDDEFSSLKNAGVFISVAAGNSFYSYNSEAGLGYPAVSPLVVSVGAVYAGNFGTVAWGSGARDVTTAADRIASFSQRGPALSLLSPGAIINSTYLGNTYKSMAGTSMASPVVAGAAAILHEALDSHQRAANQDTILALMKSTGVSVVDGDDENDNVTNTGLTFKRLDLGAAVNSLGPVNSAPQLQPIADRSLLPGQSLTITLQGSDANNDPLVYSASVAGSLASKAYSLKQQLGLKYLGSYYQNYWGADERWLTSEKGDAYCILPNGEFRRWAGSMAATMQAGSLVAILNDSYYADPKLLWDAKWGTTALPTLNVVGNQLNIQAPTGVSETYQIEATVSDGAASATQRFSLVVRNSKPVLQPISNQRVTPGMSLTLTLVATDAEGSALTFTARVTGTLSAQAYALKQSLGLKYAGSYSENYYGAGERWISGDKNEYYCILPNGELRRWAGSFAETMRATSLIATLDNDYHADPRLLWDAKAITVTPPTLSIAGNQLTIQSSPSMSEAYWIEVSVSDGANSVARSFLHTVRNSKPVLQPIASQLVTPGRSLAITLNSSDVDGDALTYSARVADTLSAQAYALKQTLNLKATTSYYENSYGLGERWLQTTSGDWYCILPNGELRRWSGSVAATLEARNLVATFDAAFHADPSLLWNPSGSAAGALPVLAVSGNQLTIQSPTNVSEGYRIEVSVRDGTATTTGSFVLSVRNRAPVLQPIADQNAAPGATLSVPLVAFDADNDAITFSARVLPTLASSAFSLKSQLGLRYAGSYYQNYHGLNEKWITSDKGDFYCILPNGEFRKWAGTVSATTQSSNLVATFDASYHADPSRLWNAQAPTGAAPILTVSGSQLIIQVPTGASDRYVLEVSASDGKAEASRSFTLTAKLNTAPQITAIATQNMQSNRGQAITITATDAQGDALSYQARIIGSFSKPPATLVLAGNQLTIHSSPDFVGSFDVQVTVSDGALESSATFRVNVTASNVAVRLEGDFNGDNLGDVAEFQYDGGVWVSLSNSDGTFQNRFWSQWASASNWAAIGTGDFNGDGKDDLICFANTGSVWVGLSDGSSFNANLWAQWSAASNWNELAIMDVDGDGRADLVGLNVNGKYYVGYSTGTSFNTVVWSSTTQPAA